MARGLFFALRRKAELRATSDYTGRLGWG